MSPPVTQRDAPATEQLADALVPIAVQLVATVRDFGPAEVADVLARVPDGRHDALAVVLAAMVDPDKRASQLLAWTVAGPVRSRAWTPPSTLLANLPHDLGRRAERRAEVARLTAAGLSSLQIAERLGITRRSVTRHRAALRDASRAA